jgi:hypothetical protein
MTGAWWSKLPPTMVACCIIFGKMGSPFLGVETTASTAEVAIGKGIDTVAKYSGLERSRVEAFTWSG